MNADEAGLTFQFIREFVDHFEHPLTTLSAPAEAIAPHQDPGES